MYIVILFYLLFTLGVIAAKDGTLTFMVGGSKENFDFASPLLKSMGSRIVHCGDVGMGQAAKLCNNMLLAISMIGTAETFNLGQKYGTQDFILNYRINCWHCIKLIVLQIGPGSQGVNRYREFE